MCLPSLRFGHGLSPSLSPTLHLTQARAKTELKPLASHSHSMEGYAMDWSPVKTGLFASGDNNKRIHVWEPQVR